MQIRILRAGPRSRSGHAGSFTESDERDATPNVRDAMHVNVMRRAGWNLTGWAVV
jgi:hypothetical protein